MVSEIKSHKKRPEEQNSSKPKCHLLSTYMKYYECKNEFNFNTKSNIVYHWFLLREVLFIVQACCGYENWKSEFTRFYLERTHAYFASTDMRNHRTIGINLPQCPAQSRGSGISLLSSFHNQALNISRIGGADKC